MTNLANGRSVIVRINDRGPFVSGRSIDLSRTAAEHIGMARKGIGTVKISELDGHYKTDTLSASAPGTTPYYLDPGDTLAEALHGSWFAPSS